MSEPVRRTHIVPHAPVPTVYDVIVDFPAYPRVFKEFTAVRVLSTREAPGGPPVVVQRVEFRASMVIAVRYVLDLVCDPQARTVTWTYVEGDIVTDSRGAWRLREVPEGTQIDYEAMLTVNAPLPGFMLRKITDTILSASLPAMFAALDREVAARATSRA